MLKLLFVCMFVAGIANAAPKSSQDTIDIERDKVLNESRNASREQEKTLRESERTEIRALSKDLSPNAKDAALQAISKNYSQQRWAIRRRANADLRVRLLGIQSKK